jgi:surfeit locus 1 family protein
MTETKFPVVSSIIVALAVGVMLALGVWQLDRKQEKEAQLAQLAANRDMPAIAYPMLGPFDETLLFRKSSVTCLTIEGWSVDAGKASDDKTGFRYIANCSTGIEGPGARVAIGVGARPDLKPAWNGGTIAGWIVMEGGESSLIEKLTGKSKPATPMLIADKGQGGLKTSAVPSIESVPNNHLAYAVQWFLFAAIAAIIYVILLRRRRKVAVQP